MCIHSSLSRVVKLEPFECARHRRGREFCKGMFNDVPWNPAKLNLRGLMASDSINELELSVKLNCCSRGSYASENRRW